MGVVEIPKYPRKDLLKSARLRAAQMAGEPFKMSPIPFVIVRAAMKEPVNSITTRNLSAMVNVYLLLAEANKPKPKKR